MFSGRESRGVIETQCIVCHSSPNSGQGNALAPNQTGMARQTSSIQKPRSLIAVIDDDCSVLTSLARLLRSAGYAAIAFGSAQEFLDSLKATSPQCLVIDVQMPEMTGFELQSRLRELRCTVPIIFITAHDSPATRAIISQTGTGLLTKPFKGAALLKTIDKVVAKTARCSP